jgi:hypothetical protein
MLHRVALVRTDVSDELSASIIKVTIGELGTTVAVTSNRSTLYFFATSVDCYLRLTFLFHIFLSPWWRRPYVPPIRRFSQKPHGVTSNKTPLFLVTAVKTSNLFLKDLSFECRLSISFHKAQLQSCIETWATCLCRRDLNRSFPPNNQITDASFHRE